MMLRHFNKLKYLLIGGILLTGCTFTGNFNNDLVVIAIDRHADGCVYRLSKADSNDAYHVKDICGKFNIGDTLYLTKTK